MPRIPIACLFLPLAGMMAASLAYPAGAKSAETDKQAEKRAEQEAIRRAVSRGEVRSLVQILSIARSRVPGEVIKVELEQEKWGIKYEVKILTRAGRVREVELDARTGRIINIEDD